MLTPGDRVALVSPSGPVPADRVDAAVRVLTGWGLIPQVYPHALERNGYFAGTDAQRLADLNDALTDPAIRAVLCLRGGYGMQRIVDDLDYAAIRQAVVAEQAKLVMGFSDITALHLALWHEARLPTVHGPVAAQFDKGPDSLTAQSAKHVMMTAEPVVIKQEVASAVRTEGVARGKLLGGNLALVVSTVGTPHMPDLTGAILLVEDVNEYPYRVDRMLTHLRRAGVLDGLAGVAVGQFTDCAATSGPTVEEVLHERLAGLGLPVLGGLPIGHGEQHVAVPLGTEAVMDVDSGLLTVQPIRLSGTR